MVLSLLAVILAVDRLLDHRDVELATFLRPDAKPVGVEYLGAILLDFALLAAWAALYYGINYFLLLEEQIDQRERLESQASTAQLAMLRYQLNPHFLFNTLNSISTLVLLKQTERANAMLARLSSFLRYTLANEPTAKVTLAQEVETLKLYLEIEKMRFEDRLAAAFQDRFRDDRRAAAVAAAPALDRKCDQICRDPERKGRRHLDHRATVRAQAVRIEVADNGTAKAAMSRPARRPASDWRTFATVWRRPMARPSALRPEQNEQGGSALSSKFPLKPETMTNDHPDHAGR